jgi:hypothetical protein
VCPCNFSGIVGAVVGDDEQAVSFDELGAHGTERCRENCRFVVRGNKDADGRSRR